MMSERLARFEFGDASAKFACGVKVEIEVACTSPIRQLFQSTIAASRERRKNTPTRGQGRFSGRSSLRP
jgi:hypothetical protein